MLLTRELWMQNDQGCNGGKAQLRMDCSALSHRSFPEQVHIPHNGVTQPKGCISVLPAIRGYPSRPGTGRLSLPVG